MNNYEISQILELITDEYRVEGKKYCSSITNISTPELANSNSLIWIKPKYFHSNIIENTKAEVIICGIDSSISDEQLQHKCFILVNDPKLTFIRIATALFGEKKKQGIHPSATIDSKATLGKDIFIGSNSIIGEANIGDGTVIIGNCYIGNNVDIGKNVFINAGVVIGSEGFGYSRNQEGQLEKFPHFGGVIIQDHVEIGANTCIDRGTLGNTFIGEGTKIDNLVHIAHNVVIGKNSLIIANAMIGGSTVIGEESWVAPSVSLMNGITIGKKVTIGMSALVTKNIPDGETWTGSPACQLEKFVEIQRKIKKL